MLDSDGYILYNTCKEILKCDVTKIFTSDESSGRFETTDGYGMKRYAEIYCFGTYDLEYVGCYEILGEHKIDFNTPAYFTYEQELWPKAVANVLNKFRIGDYEDIPKIFKAILDLKSESDHEQINDFRLTRDQKATQDCDLNFNNASNNAEFCNNNDEYEEDEEMEV